MQQLLCNSSTMKIPLNGMTVHFSYDYVYPEQYDYMCALKQTLSKSVDVQPNVKKKV